MLDQTIAKLSRGTKIHSKPQINILIDTYRFFYRVYHVERKYYSPHVYRLVLEAAVGYRVNKEGEKGKGR